MRIRFTKMHGLGNDYLFVDAREQPVEDPAWVAQVLSDRHRGVGSDGLILVLAPEGEHAQARMRMFNADGSEGEMCGNGIRCLGKFLLDGSAETANPLLVETGAGELTLDCTRGSDGLVQQVRVSMGEPKLASADMPARIDGIAPGDPVIDHAFEPSEFGFDADSIRRGGVQPRLSLVSMGNPHAIIHCSDPAGVDLGRVGAVFEHHKAFPNRINLHLVRVLSDVAVEMRTWERGSGITQACGTGACAVCVEGVLSARHSASIAATLPGGVLHLEWGGLGTPVIMRGPAVEVFQGEADLRDIVAGRSG